MTSEHFNQIPGPSENEVRAMESLARGERARAQRMQAVDRGQLDAVRQQLAKVNQRKAERAARKAARAARKRNR